MFQDVLPTMQVDNDANNCYSMIQSLEHVLQNINKLNRSLEEVIAVRQSHCRHALDLCVHC
jgi:DASH complex subunit Dad1